ncbi:MAG: hypothetical protein HY516_02275 [Candidatus Aenigmarchaeota archaeon]|nr:hypothetical protein [Candidatus Aenigmarchaeota archaeon]
MEGIDVTNERDAMELFADLSDPGIIGKMMAEARFVVPLMSEEPSTVILGSAGPRKSTDVVDSAGDLYRVSEAGEHARPTVKGFDITYDVGKTIADAERALKQPADRRGYSMLLRTREGLYITKQFGVHAGYFGDYFGVIEPDGKVIADGHKLVRRENKLYVFRGKYIARFDYSSLLEENKAGARGDR